MAKFSSLPRPWPPFALQLTYVHLAMQWRCAKAINHLGACSGVACQGQSIHSAAKHQAEHDVAVA
jgi:hypothetical protein